MCKTVLSTHIQPNTTKPMGRHLAVQMDNDPEHTAKATQDFLKWKKLHIFQRPSASFPTKSMQFISMPFSVEDLKAERARNKEQLKAAAAVQGQKVTSLGFRQADTDCKGFHPSLKKMVIFTYLCLNFKMKKKRVVVYLQTEVGLVHATVICEL